MKITGERLREEESEEGEEESETGEIGEFALDRKVE